MNLKIFDQNFKKYSKNLFFFIDYYDILLFFNELRTVDLLL